MSLPTETALTLPEVLRHLPFGESRLRKLIKEGKVPTTRVSGKLYIFASELKASPIGALWRA